MHQGDPAPYNELRDHSSGGTWNPALPTLRVQQQSSLQPLVCSYSLMPSPHVSSQSPEVRNYKGPYRSLLHGGSLARTTNIRIARRYGRKRRLSSETLRTDGADACGAQGSPRGWPRKQRGCGIPTRPSVAGRSSKNVGEEVSGGSRGRPGWAGGWDLGRELPVCKLLQEERATFLSRVPFTHPWGKF